VSGVERVEWAIDYHDGTGPIPASTEVLAYQWANYATTHDQPATVVSRTVTTTPWQPTTQPRTPAGSTEESHE
jgi:hypothetical protein